MLVNLLDAVTQRYFLFSVVAMDNLTLDCGESDSSSRRFRNTILTPPESNMHHTQTQ